MINPIVVKAINCLPPSLIKRVTKRVIDRLLNKYANITVENGEELQKLNGPVIIVSNHISNSDALVLNRVLKDLEPYFVAGVKLQKTSLSRIGFEAFKTVPIKPDSADIEAMKKSIEIVNQGNSLFIFPEGTRSRTGQLLQGHKGVMLIAKKCGVPILPIGITGTDKLMPINDTDMGKEAFYAADVKVKIGKPFLLPEKEVQDSKDSYNEKCMKAVMGGIAALLPPERRGFYK